MCHALHVSYTHDKGIYLNHLFQTMNHILYVEESIITLIYDKLGNDLFLNNW